MLHRQLWMFLVLAYLSAGFAYLWPQAYRENGPVYVWTSWIAFQIRTFIFYAGWVATFFAAVAFWRRWRRLALTALPLILVTTLPTFWRCLPKQIAPTTAEAFTVMSVNLLMINEQTDATIAAIEAVDPEILFLQEYSGSWHAILKRSFADRYPHHFGEPRGDSFGMAIYSKRPLRDVRLDLPLGQALEPQMRAVTTLGGRDVALYQCHLLPPCGLDYISETRAQFADLLLKLDRERLPVVLVGDFNFSDTSPQAADLGRAGLRDAHQQAGTGTGFAWPAPGFLWWMPKLRLDHIYLRSPLRAVESRRGGPIGSDHRPVLARITLDGPPAAQESDAH
jgi:endonuclease/exonuclease/phosphatase (EEP) superfamily protein YafD